MLIHTCAGTSSMNRSQAMRFLHDLALPMGSVERDERDGFVGLWTSEDCQPGKDGKPVKNLETIWKDLNGEQNLRWDATNTVVITHKPEEMVSLTFPGVVGTCTDSSISSLHSRSTASSCRV